MQYLDLTRVGSTTEIDCQLQEMIVQGLLVEDEMRAVQTEKIAHFFASSLGQRMLHSSQVYREVPFNLVCKAAQVLEDINAGDEELLVQGVIDLYFVEGDDLVLVDYKTDYISAQNRAALIAQYTVQINMYRQALESILQKKVKESYLYLFHPEETIAIA
jgi:ATP-dependent helicase/nuclease subunit A